MILTSLGKKSWVERGKGNEFSFEHVEAKISMGHPIQDVQEVE